ncbi:MAG TPA: tetratricopeptide repeat protein [Terriglobales bacterium]|nr:tetratricopeptide repeat protein [Terriglobales bacterium]
MRRSEQRVNGGRKTAGRALAICALAGVMLVAAGCDKLRARDQLNKGVQSYKNARYEEAIDHFKNAVQQDPSLINARLYLATAYAQQYIPGVDSPDNVKYGEQAIEEYKNVLQRDSKNVNSVKGIAYLYLQMKKFDDAKEYYKKAIELDPNDPEAYYSVAVIDWTQSYKDSADLKAAEGMKVDDDVTGKKNDKLCQQLKEKNEPRVNEGIDMLKKALDLRPDYDDAMAYMNLLYRRKGDIACGDSEARQADLKTADEWVDKTMATKKAKAEKQQGPGGITLDQPTK